MTSLADPATTAVSDMAVAYEPIDVLLLQLGTPDAPTARALRPYLREFLSDPRVLEMPALARWLLVNLIIVPFRAPKSAKKYARIWHPERGSPLLDTTHRQTEALGSALGEQFRVHFAMRYGRPSVQEVLGRLAAQGAHQIFCLPMYPQYSATTTASGLDAFFAAIRKQRVTPSVRILRNFHLHSAYLAAVQASIEQRIREAEDAGTPPDHFVLSFHGIPIDYVKRGDPYMRQCAETAKRIAKNMRWDKGDWTLTFQSRLGRQKWLLPYFDEKIKELARAGKQNVLVAQPGFTTDCLETIDEIGNEGREDFEAAGGKHLLRVACLNDRPEFIEALKTIVLEETAGWR